jgi:hypothetical protein
MGLWRQGSCHQLLEVAQGLDQLLPHQLLRFTSKQYWRMNFLNGRNTTDSALGDGGVILCVEPPLDHEAFLEQHRVCYPLKGCQWWGTHKKVVFNYNANLTCKVMWC